MTKTTAQHAVEYIEKLGWGLVNIPANSKAPKAFMWQKHAIQHAMAAESYWETHPDHNMGLLHNVSQTCAIDVDNVEHTKLIFASLGLDYDAIISSAPQIQGKPGRGKAIFRLPDGVNFQRKSISWPLENDATKSETIFELRAGDCQDVLPPSIHPDTGKPYKWIGANPLDGLPELPAPILTMWREWERFKPQLMSICPWYSAPTNKPSKPRPAGDFTSSIEAYNNAVSINDALALYGYKKVAHNRWLSPNSSSGLAGVNVFDDGRAFSHHASDPFDSAHTFDAFDLFCQYEHGGDASKAARAAMLALNIQTAPAFEAPCPVAVAEGGEIASRIFGASKDRGQLSDIPDHLLSVPGRLQDMVNFYNTTAPKEQPQFAVQAALALGSVVMGRKWVTDQRNMTGLYFVNVGKSAGGKEHVKTSLERVLEAAELSDLIGPSGYTSASGVFSALIDQPAHISIIDELGRVLKTAGANGNHHKVEAQTILMEVFGRQTSTLRPQGYSKIGMNKSQSKELEKIVRHPSLTLMTMTTPSTLYDNLSSSYVSDGFLGRFIIVESPIGRQPSRLLRPIEPGDQLIEWCKAHNKIGDMVSEGSFDVAPDANIVPFSKDCHALLQQCDRDMLDRMDKYERFGMEAMFGRTKEIAQRLALIVARSCGEDQISTHSLQWSIDYATFYADRTARALRNTMADSDFHGAVKAVYDRISKAGFAGMTERELSKSVAKFAGLKPRERREVLEAVANDYGVQGRDANEGKPGRSKIVWYLPADEGE
jgi:hypothetical protein